MPGRTKTHKFSAAKESEFRVRALDVLNSSDNAMTIEQIQNNDMVLRALSSQKMSRVLGYLVEMGFVRKAKSKTLGRMVYKTVSKMREQGYEEPAAGGYSRPYNGLEWDFEDSLAALVNKTEDEEDEGEE